MTKCHHIMTKYHHIMTMYHHMMTEYIIEHLIIRQLWRSIAIFDFYVFYDEDFEIHI